MNDPAVSRSSKENMKAGVISLILSVVFHSLSYHANRWAQRTDYLSSNIKALSELVPHYLCTWPLRLGQKLGIAPSGSEWLQYTDADMTNILRISLTTSIVACSFAIFWLIVFFRKQKQGTPNGS
jgi:hypothetical protein